MFPLNEEDIQNYIKNNGVDYSEFQLALQEHNLNDLVQVPFFLNRLCLLYKKEHSLPGRSQLMIQLIQDSMDYDEAKYSLTQPDYEDVQEKAINCLSELGFSMQCLQLHQLEEQTYKSLFSSVDRNYIKYSSLWKKENNTWAFEHNHFQEFLAANYLKEQNLDEVFKIITYPSNNQKIKTSWVNTVSHLLTLVTSSSLVNWIIDNDPETLLYIDHSILSDEAAEKAFYRLFDGYSRDRFIFPSYGPETEGLKELVRTPSQVNYLLKVLKASENETAKINTLKLLNVITNFGTYKQGIREAVLQLICTSPDTVTFINAVFALCNPALFCNDDVNLIEKHADNAEKQLAVLQYISSVKLYDSEISYVAELLTKKFPEELSASLSFRLDDIAKNISLPDSLITILRAVPTNYDNGREYSSKKLAEIVFNRAADLYVTDNHKLVTEIYEFYYRSIVGFSNIYHKFIQNFLSATGNTINCYKYMAEHHPDIFDYRYLLIDVNHIDAFIEEYTNNTLPKADYFVEFAKRQPNNAEYFKNLSVAINKKTGEHITGITVYDYKSIELSVYQEIFDSLFDTESYKSLIRHFLADINADENTTFEQLAEMDLSLVDYRPRNSIIFNYLCNASSSKLAILSLPSDADWDNISVRLMVKILKTRNDIAVSEKQKLFFSNYVNENIQDIDWQKELTYNDNGWRCSYKTCIIPYLSSRLSLDFTEEQYIDMLYLPKDLFFQDSMEGFLPKYLVDHLSPDVVLHTIEKNIADGIAKWNLANNYISYCSKVNSEIAVDLAFSILSDDKYGYHYKWTAASYLITLERSEMLIDKFSETTNTDLLKIMASLFSGLWVSNQEKLVLRLEKENQNAAGSLLFMSELLAMNSRYALDVYTSYVRKNNAIPEAVDTNADKITENIAKITEISLIDLIKELFVLSYADGFKDSEYIGLRYAVTKALENYADEYYETVLKVLNTVKSQHADNNDLYSQCSNIIYFINMKYYRKEDMPMDVTATKMLLQELRK